MIEGLPLGPLLDGTATVLVVVVVLWLVVRRKLVPLSHHDEVVTRILSELARESTRADRAEKQRDEAFELAQSMADMNMEVVRQKDAARAAVESVKAYAEQKAGEDP